MLDLDRGTHAVASSWMEQGPAEGLAEEESLTFGVSSLSREEEDSEGRGGGGGGGRSHTTCNCAAGGRDLVMFGARIILSLLLYAVRPRHFSGAVLRMYLCVIWCRVYGFGSDFDYWMGKQGIMVRLPCFWTCKTMDTITRVKRWETRHEILKKTVRGSKTRPWFLVLSTTVSRMPRCCRVAWDSDWQSWLSNTICILGVRQPRTRKQNRVRVSWPWSVSMPDELHLLASIGSNYGVKCRSLLFPGSSIKGNE
ncbi:uncharacterized protein BDZ83DRAFT_640695 [Colletotrichum acutatum]|uniref:Uncharacterized protein n=1 Tax=Glomerella acutata TaxID=27357 RepID=A0AAD8X8V7_GLOAC|nr:uncharacterized protein BDZ83DRAFT_640695 [Colletotrichum acutatum]KAK1710309.1 hypothetical protein BDZ83DRAFT_640695 [Colletotrichum acutatum]